MAKRGFLEKKMLAGLAPLDFPSAFAVGAAGNVKKFVAKVVTECAFGINE